MAILRNQPKVQASDSCVEGITSSAIFRPGEKRETSHPGAAASFGTAQASARKPASKPSTAGKTQRKNERLGMRTDCIKGPTLQLWFLLLCERLHCLSAGFSVR
jgi:hypothetical protein